MNCDQHDYIEIACTFRYPIKITLKSGRVIYAVGLNTGYNADREECLEIDEDGQRSLIVLDHIAQLDTCVDNPHFQSITFNQ